MPTPGDQRYKVTWVETSHHEGEYTAEELADMAGCTLEEFMNDPDNFTSELEDGLAEVSDEAFSGLERDLVEIELLDEDQNDEAVA